MNSFGFNIDKGYTPNILSAIIGADSFFYGLFDENKNLYSCKHFKDVVFNDEFIGEISNLLSKYKDVKQKITFTTKPYLHLPENEEDITRFYPAFLDKRVESDVLDKQDLKVIYGLKAEHISFMEHCFNSPEVFHISKILTPRSTGIITKPCVYAHIDDNTLHLIAHDMGNLKYYNQFRCEHKNDFLYFTMMVYDLMSYNRYEVPLHVSGRIDRSSEIYKLLYEYIKNVSFANTAGLIVSDIRFKETSHYYYDLYKTAICE